MKLTSAQQSDVDRARAFAAAAEAGRGQLAGYLGISDDVNTFYTGALGAARSQLDALLGVIDALTGASGRPAPGKEG